MASLYKISSKSINWFKSYLGAHARAPGQTFDLISLLSFLESRLKMDLVEYMWTGTIRLREGEERSQKHSLIE
jgi:hypothetical protein